LATEGMEGGMGCLEVGGLEAVLLRSLEARLAGPPGTLEAWPGGDVPTATWSKYGRFLAGPT
jgi:hypothetical protein